MDGTDVEVSHVEPVVVKFCLPPLAVTVITQSLFDHVWPFLKPCTLTCQVSALRIIFMIALTPKGAQAGFNHVECHPLADVVHP